MSACLFACMYVYVCMYIYIYCTRLDDELTDKVRSG